MRLATGSDTCGERRDIATFFRSPDAPCEMELHLSEAAQQRALTILQQHGLASGLFLPFIPFTTRPNCPHGDLHRMHAAEHMYAPNRTFDFAQSSFRKCSR
jgi:hypothetical protein